MTELQKLMDMVAVRWQFNKKSYPARARYRTQREQALHDLQHIGKHLSYGSIAGFGYELERFDHDKPVNMAVVKENLRKMFAEMLRAVEVLGFNAQSFLGFCIAREEEEKEEREGKRKKPMRERHRVRTRRG